MEDYRIILDVLIVSIALVTLLVIVGGFYFWRDRQTMRKEITEDAKKTVEKDAKKVMDEARKELGQYAQKLKEEMEKEIRKVKVRRKEAEKLTEEMRELASVNKAVLAEPTQPSGVETDKEKEARDLLEKGNEFYEKEDFDTAIYNYTKAIDKNPSYTAAFNNRGIAYDDKGDYDTAIRDYTKTIELDPNYTAAFYNRGIAYKNKGDYDAAIRDYTKAIELDPNDAGAMANMGIAYKKKGDKEKARIWYKKAIEKKEYLPDGGEKIRQWLKEL